MGAGQSRRRPGKANQQSVADAAKMTFGANIPPPKAGYFVMSLKPDKIKVVNADAGVLRLMTNILKRHVIISKEGWDRHLTYSYRLKISSCHSMIQMVADTLMGLYQSGWEPMTPLEMNKKRMAKTDIVSSSRIDICFSAASSDLTNHSMGSSYSLGRESLQQDDNCCLCLQTFRDSYLICHNVSNTVLYDLVTSIQEQWTPGIIGVSTAVASVIQVKRKIFIFKEKYSYHRKNISFQGKIFLSRKKYFYQWKNINIIK